MCKVYGWIAVGVAVAVLAGCSDDHTTSVRYPESERAFHALNQQCQQAYAVGQNEIQKSLAFNRCNKSRSQFAKDNRVQNWVGNITDISTDQGADVVSVSISSRSDGVDLAFGTVSNRVSDYATNSLITQSNPLFNVLANMKIGDTVLFDAEFLSHPESERGIWESSLTEKGSIEDPEFNVRFTKIQPYTQQAVEALSAVATPPEPRVATKPEATLSKNAARANGTYESVRTALMSAGYKPNHAVDLQNGFPHEVDGDPANCGMAGCQLPWVSASGNKKCVAVLVNDGTPEAQWKASILSSPCDGDVLIAESVERDSTEKAASAVDRIVTLGNQAKDAPAIGTDYEGGKFLYRDLVNGGPYWNDWFATSNPAESVPVGSVAIHIRSKGRVFFLDDAILNCSNRTWSWVDASVKAGVLSVQDIEKQVPAEALTNAFEVFCEGSRQTAGGSN